VVTDRASYPDGAEVQDSLGADESPVVPWWRRASARVGYVVLGAGFGLAVAWASAHRGSPQWVVWASLAVALTAASGAVFGYGLARWPQAAGPDPVDARRVVHGLGGLAAVGAAMLAVGIVLTAASGRSLLARHDGDLIGSLLTMFAVVGAAPVAADLAAVRDRTRRLPDPVGERAEVVLALRGLLSPLLNAMGALVAIATLALGAGGRLGDEDFESTIVVVFGANMSVLMALAYAPAAGAVGDSAQQLAARAVPLANVTEADLPDRLDARKRLEQALGVDRGLFADLQSGLVILAPLLASGAAVFLPG
jgi:hypothetical protein